MDFAYVGVFTAGFLAEITLGHRGAYWLHHGDRF